MDIEKILNGAQFKNNAHKERLKQQLFGAKIVELTDDELEQVSAAGVPKIGEGARREGGTTSGGSGPGSIVT